LPTGSASTHFPGGTGVPEVMSRLLRWPSRGGCGTGQSRAQQGSRSCSLQHFASAEIRHRGHQGTISSMEFVAGINAGSGAELSLRRWLRAILWCRCELHNGRREPLGARTGRTWCRRDIGRRLPTRTGQPRDRAPRCERWTSCSSLATAMTGLADHAHRPLSSGGGGGHTYGSGVRAVLIEIGRAAARVAVFSLAKSLNQADRSLKNSVISPVFRSITVAVWSNLADSARSRRLCCGFLYEYWRNRRRMISTPQTTSGTGWTFQGG